ncbi:hypothetical protein QBC41DRAFT_62066 [Cercophora samala]|uniref:Uncharacterized protein n=1 Tax=Cercophora samala TaxID=330535 RepID=A0AA40DEW8_9PEZI|nr:hypothetical protein QBC41DRAFT_62066 [Cercophora samala]
MASPRKRRRTQPPVPPSDQVINPLSHPPATLKQFTLAGLSHDSPLLSDLYPGFPHRPPRPARRRHQYTSQSDDHSSNLTDKSGDEGGDERPDLTTDDDGPIGARTTAGEETDFSSGASASGRRRKKNSKKEREKDRKTLAYNAKVGVLINTVKKALAEGDIPLAKRAFGLLARAKVNGRKVDLRHERLWELGAEIILREGETTTTPSNPPTDGNNNNNDIPDNQEGEFKTAFHQQTILDENDSSPDDQADRQSRLQDRLFHRQQSNLANVQSYYQHLIQHHPFSKQHPSSTGRPLLELTIALFSSETEAIHALHRRSLERIDEKDTRGEFYDIEDEMDMIVEEENEEEPSDSEHMDVDDGDKKKPPPTPPREKRKQARVREEKEEVRGEILKKMRGVAERMDALSETMPFSRDGEFARLRAMVGLYIGDLCVPFEEGEKKAGYRAREKERQKARRLLEGVRDTGKGVLQKEDEELLKMLGSDDDEDEDEHETSEGEEEEGDDDEVPQLEFFSSIPA